MRLMRSRRELEAAGLAGNALVPTMGALHEGHAALIRRGSALAAERRLPAGCVVTIFVNPTQFNDKADLDRYPRTLERDLALCEASGAAAVFAPGVEDVYPAPDAVPIPPLPRAATEPGLEDARRPGHFAGVCQVVLRLFALCRPSIAVFGEKDWQQLAVIRAMTAEQRLPIEIVGHPTIREADGLAMSSRNVFLSPAERGAAGCIPWALRAAGRCGTVGEAELMMRRVIERAGLEVEYAVVRDAATLTPVPRTGRGPRPLRALIAARAGRTRLIDNADWPGGF